MWPTKTYTFSPSTTIASAALNQNFDDMLSAINMAMPSGSIMLWSGSVGTIPAGYYLCDGNNGTPNLAGKFIQGAGAGYAVGASGGSATHAHVGAAHTHTYSTTTSQRTDANDKSAGGGASAAWNLHVHTVSGTTSGAVEDLTTSTTDTRPPFYTLVYMMKS